MKAIGILSILCGLVITAVVTYEFATGSVSFPIMFLLGPGFVFAGVFEVARGRERR